MSAALHIVDPPEGEPRSWTYKDDPGAMFRWPPFDRDGREAWCIALPNEAGLWWTTYEDGTPNVDTSRSVMSARPISIDMNPTRAPLSHPARRNCIPRAVLPSPWTMIGGEDAEAQARPLDANVSGDASEARRAGDKPMSAVRPALDLRTADGKQGSRAADSRADVGTPG